MPQFPEQYGAEGPPRHEVRERVQPLQGGLSKQVRDIYSTYHRGIYYIMQNIQNTIVMAMGEWLLGKEIR